jgi:hypothetical protein
VGCLGGGGGAGTGLGVGRMALTAATFCVFLTLETVTFLDAVFLAGAFGAGFLLFAECLATVTFFVVRAFAVLFRTEAFETAPRDTVALFAFGFEADLAFTARFAVFEEGRFTAVRADDRRKPFERLLLILGLISKGCSVTLSSRRIAAQLSTASRLNQLSQLFAGALSLPSVCAKHLKLSNIEKHLMVIVCYVTVRLAHGGIVLSARSAPTEIVTSFRFKNLRPTKLRFGFHSPKKRLPAPAFKKSRDQWQIPQSCCVSSNTTN